MGISLSHILLLVLLYLIFFKPQRLTKALRSIKEATSEFKKSLNEIEIPPEDIKDQNDLIKQQKKNTKAEFKKL